MDFSSSKEKKKEENKIQEQKEEKERENEKIEQNQELNKSEEKEIIFKVYGEYFTGIRLLYTILMFINDYLGDIFMFQIIDKFSVSHAALAYTLDSFAGKLYQIIADNVAGKTVSWEVYVNFCVYFLVFIGAMIHNEIFIINKCGLNEKTQLYLDNEFRKESTDNEKIILRRPGQCLFRHHPQLRGADDPPHGDFPPEEGQPHRAKRTMGSPNNVFMLYC